MSNLSQDSVKAFIKASLKPGSVHYITLNQSEGFNSPEPHYFIVVSEQSDEEDILYVCCTSQLEKIRKRMHFQKLSEETVVFTDPEEYTVLSKDTAINCNSIFIQSLDELVRKFQESGSTFKLKSDVPEELRDRIIKGVRASKQVSRGHKDRLPKE